MHTTFRSESRATSVPNELGSTPPSYCPVRLYILLRLQTGQYARWGGVVVFLFSSIVRPLAFSTVVVVGRPCIAPRGGPYSLGTPVWTCSGLSPRGPGARRQSSYRTSTIFNSVRKNRNDCDTMRIGEHSVHCVLECPLQQIFLRFLRYSRYFRSSRLWESPSAHFNIAWLQNLEAHL